MSSRWFLELLAADDVQYAPANMSNDFYRTMVNLHRRGRRANHSPLERINPGHALPDDQGVNVVRSLVGLY